jgi:protease YdgD
MRESRGSRRARLGIVASALLLTALAAISSVPAAETVPGIVGGDDRRPQPYDSGWPWIAIGRVNRASGGFCTGTLIAADRVLTAAHCLWNRRRGAMLPADGLHFVPGWWRGRYRAHATASRILTDPALAFDALGRPKAAATDWAVLVLDGSSMRGQWPKPVPLAEAGLAQPGRTLGRAGYGRDRPHALSRQDGCHALGLANDGRLLLHDCDATFGDSGSPVLIEKAGGYAILGVHIAMVEQGGGNAGAAVLVTPGMAAER